MRKMMDSGLDIVGQMPNEWNFVRLRYLCNITTGNSDTQDADPDGEYLFYVRSPIIERSTKYTFDGEGILMAGDGAGAGRVFHHAFGKYAVHQRVYRLYNFKINSNFLFYYVSNLFPSVMDKGSAQSTVPSVRLPMLLNFEVCTPPLAEQQRIADFLDEKCGEIDSIRSDIQKQIDILNDYKKSVITEAVTKGLNPKAKLKDSGIEWIGKIPEGWDVKRFKYIADALYKGNGITKEQVFLDGNTQCVRYGEIYSKYNISFSDCLSLTKCELISSPQYFEYGDILFAGTGELVEEIGKNIVYLGNEKCLAGGDIVVARHSQNPSFLNYALGSSYCQSQKSSGKAKLKVVHISATQIGNILVAVPPLSEQKAIADYLDEKCSEIDATIADKQKQLETLDEYKKSLIFEYVTGKKEVLA